MNRTELNGYDTGADDYISKPFSMKAPFANSKCSAAVPSVCMPLSLTKVPYWAYPFSSGRPQSVSRDESVTITQKEAEYSPFFVRHKIKW